jgi:hypothetical protein
MNNNRKEEQNMRHAFSKLIVVLIIATGSVPAGGDEGMWLYNDPPHKLLKDKYGFEPAQAWLEHVQKSSVRFNSGGSGSFVSADGLIITNHQMMQIK